MQLWLDACPQAGKSAAAEDMAIADSGQQLLASPDGAHNGLQLRQQVWIHHLDSAKSEQS